MSFDQIKIKVPPSKSEAAAAGTVFRVLSSGVRRVEKGFTEPGDDWAPIHLAVTSDGAGTFFSGDAHKYDLVDVVSVFARKAGAVAVGSVLSSWAVENASDEVMRQQEQGTGSLEDVPGRLEVVVLMIYTASTWRWHQGLIQRFDDRPPKLGPLDLIDDSSGDARMTGRMFVPIQQALRRLG